MLGVSLPVLAGSLAALGIIALALGAAPARDEPEPGLVGVETCGMCHEDVAEAFKTNIHLRADPEGACEGCHGPGESHADEMDPELIRRLGDEAGAAIVNPACLSCHGRDRPRRSWATGNHGLGGLACTDCHDIHDAEVRKSLLAAKTPGMCTECHGEVRAAFQLPRGHPVGRGTMDCVDCHEPHGETDRRRLGGFKQRACLRCHAEYRGPWVFEHDPVAVEGCLACHSPHNTVNRHLLTYQRAGDVCLQCHTEQPFFHVLEAPNGARTTEFNDCTRCHTEIHGSNNDALFLN
jgi:DmsE family decaheme c-type cytochrome